MEAACAARGIECVYHRGCSVLDGEYEDIAGAVETAKGADAIVLVVGDVISQVGEEKDRAVLELSGKQMALFDRLRALGVPVVTVLVASKPLALGRAATDADAFICAFNGGMFGGEAVAKAVFGEINPCGRLPISFPRSSGQVPVYYNQLPGWHCQAGKGYCDLAAGPLYAFGEGMGYSPFVYSELTFDKESFKASVKVTNVGEIAGTETVQVYFNDVVSSVLTPVKQLIAFRQVALAPGESAVVEFALKREDFSLINRKEERVTEPGEFELMIGHSSRDEDLLRTAFRL